MENNYTIVTNFIYTLWYVPHVYCKRKRSIFTNNEIMADGFSAQCTPQTIRPLFWYVGNKVNQWYLFDQQHMLLPPHSISCMYDNEQRGGREGQPERGKESLFSQAVLACFREFGWSPQSLPVHASIWGLCYVSKSIVSELNNRRLTGREERLEKRHV